MKGLKNKKGFTLIELLAVIVILAVLMMIAIPAMTDVIERARRDTYASTGVSFVNQVRYLATQDEYQLPSPGHYTIVSTSLIKLETGGTRSPFNQPYDTTKSYVVIVNNGTTAYEPSYVYYIAMNDNQGSGFNLTKEDTLKESKGSVVKKGTGGKSNETYTTLATASHSLSLDSKSYTLEKAYTKS